MRSAIRKGTADWSLCVVAATPLAIQSTKTQKEGLHPAPCASTTIGVKRKPCMHLRLPAGLPGYLGANVFVRLSVCLSLFAFTFVCCLFVCLSV